MHEGKIDRDYTFTGDTRFVGMVAGNATAAADSRLDLHGMICGDLTVESRAIVNLRGSVNGTVRNSGGIVRVYGAVDNIIHNAGRTFVHPDAMIRGFVTGQTEPLDE